MQALNFTCNKCGKCCSWSTNGGVLLLLSELERISEFLTISAHFFINKFCRHIVIDTELGQLKAFAINSAGKNCVFLDIESKECKIYRVRPTQCKKLPFNFFWKDKTHFPFQCINNIMVPQGWTSEEEDREFILQIINDQPKMEEYHAQCSHR